MNLHFRLWLSLMLAISSQHLYARDKILITYEKQIELAKTVKLLIERDLGLPASLITQRYTASPCDKVAEVIIQVCVANDGSIHFPIVKRDILDRNFVPLMKTPEAPVERSIEKSVEETNEIKLTEK